MLKRIIFLMIKPDKRDDIVRATPELIAEQGFHGAPMAVRRGALAAIGLFYSARLGAATVSASDRATKSKKSSDAQKKQWTNECTAGYK
jgi:hypothetical protein